MAAKIAILGESTSTAVGATTVYTVPANKSARVGILYAADTGSSDQNYSIQIGTPGSEVTIVRNPAANVDLFTGIPQTTQEKFSDISLNEAALGGGLEATTGDRAPLIGTPLLWFLSTGDTVVVTITTNTLTDHLFQVFGVEDDA